MSTSHEIMSLMCFLPNTPTVYAQTLKQQMFLLRQKKKKEESLCLPTFICILHFVIPAPKPSRHPTREPILLLETKGLVSPSTARMQPESLKGQFDIPSRHFLFKRNLAETESYSSL